MIKGIHYEHKHTTILQTKYVRTKNNLVLRNGNCISELIVKELFKKVKMTIPFQASGPQNLKWTFIFNIFKIIMKAI